MERIPESELILNEDGSIYHLHLKPGDIADKIILVGDPERVEEVSQYFDSIEVKRENREFKTHTGYCNGQRLTVLATGIGTDNIDIVFNELDALVNVDFNSRQVKSELTSLSFYRIGTSGAIQPNIAVDSFLISKVAIGFDNLLHFYKADHVLDNDFTQTLSHHLNWSSTKSQPYVVACDPDLYYAFSQQGYGLGYTVTNVGFYGPQSRMIRLPLGDPALNDKLREFQYHENQITNLEMETAGIYGMAKLLGHKAISLNAILANRATGEFSSRPKETVQQLIQETLAIITKPS